MWHVTALLAVFLLGASPSGASSQPPLDEAPPASASIRASSDDRERATAGPEPGSVILIGLPLRKIVSQVHSAHPRDIVASDGVDLDRRYDVLLRGVDLDDHTAIRGLLAAQVQRDLGLQSRLEERIGAINRLTRLPNDPPLEPSAAGPAQFTERPGRVDAEGVRIQELVWFLRSRSPRPVIDESDLNERYDFVLEWDPRAGTSALFLSLHDLGLSILPGRGPMSRVVVEPAP